MEKYRTAGLATDDNFAHAHCMPDTYVYTNTFGVRNIYSFSSATLLGRTHLSVPLYVTCLKCDDNELGLLPILPLLLQLLQLLLGLLLLRWNKSICSIYRVIHKSLRDFRTRLRNNQDRHSRKEHINS